MKYFIVILALIMMSGCNKFNEQQLRCSPIAAEGCIGFLGDKPIFIEEEL